MKKRNIVRIVSFGLTAVAILLGFTLTEHGKVRSRELQINNAYIRSLNALETSMNNITDSLNKASYMTGGTDLLNLSTTLFCEGETAKNALAALPGGSDESMTINKFLSQVGNYAVSISKKALSGEINADESEQLSKLYKTSKTISGVIGDVNKSYDNIEEFARIVNDKIDKKVDIMTLSSSLKGLEEELNDYPTLIYDGPFSDHILEKEPIMTSNAPAWSKENCKKRAEDFFGLNNKLHYSGEQNGKIKSYIFEGDNVYCSVAKNGGYISYMRRQRDIGEYKLSAENAVKKATDFLKKNGLENMEETYYYAEGGECTVNFAYKSGDTLCYTDLIKVGVAMDNGEIVFYEANGYLTNHTTRVFDPASHTIDEAREKVSKKLTVLSSKSCLIPTDSGSEVRCYEFLCENEEKSNVFVYISVKKLSTVKILLVDKSAAGVLVK